MFYDYYFILFILPQPHIVACDFDSKGPTIKKKSFRSKANLTD